MGDKTSVFMWQENVMEKKEEERWNSFVIKVF